MRHYYQASQTTVVFQPESVVAEGGRVPIALLPRTHTAYMWATFNPGEKTHAVAAASASEVPYRNEDGLGVYHFSGTDVVVPTGFRTARITAKP